MNETFKRTTVEVYVHSTCNRQLIWQYVPETKMPPKTALELTPQSGDKIVAILRSGIGPTAFPVFRCGAAQRQAVGPQPINTRANEGLHESHPKRSTTVNHTHRQLGANGCTEAKAVPASQTRSCDRINSSWRVGHAFTIWFVLGVRNERHIC